MATPSRRNRPERPFTEGLRGVAVLVATTAGLAVLFYAVAHVVASWVG